MAKVRQPHARALTLCEYNASSRSLPQLSGRELIERLGPRRPKMKVLYMSGYTVDAIVRHGLLDERLELLQKPFAADTLARKIRTILDAPRGAD
jgi:two-component system cell cycle sensor histidine kinase/response regulator CckA